MVSYPSAHEEQGQHNLKQPLHEQQNKDGQRHKKQHIQSMPPIIIATIHPTIIGRLKFEFIQKILKNKYVGFPT